MRPIDADALFKALGFAEPCSECDHVIGRFCADQIWADVCDAIYEAPTIDAEPVRHGKWIIEDNPGTGWYRVTCSECGEDVTSTAPCIGFFPNAKVTWDYCPYCGAKMDKVKP